MNKGVLWLVFIGLFLLALGCKFKLKEALIINLSEINWYAEGSDNSENRDKGLRMGKYLNVIVKGRPNCRNIYFLQSKNGGVFKKLSLDSAGSFKDTLCFFLTDNSRSFNCSGSLIGTNDLLKSKYDLKYLNFLITNKIRKKDVNLVFNM